jgi:hypothetical protein
MPVWGVYNNVNANLIDEKIADFLHNKRTQSILLTYDDSIVSGLRIVKNDQLKIYIDTLGHMTAFAGSVQNFIYEQNIVYYNFATKTWQQVVPNFTVHMYQVAVPKEAMMQKIKEIKDAFRRHFNVNVKKRLRVSVHLDSNHATAPLITRQHVKEHALHQAAKKVRRHRAAQTIQARWKNASSNPYHPMGRRHLLNIYHRNLAPTLGGM